MALKRLLPALAIVACLTACGPPTVDTSSTTSLVLSVDKIRTSLQPDEQARFDDAFAYLTNNAQLSGEAESLSSDLEACATISGMTAEQVIRQAWTTRVATIGQRITGLETRRDAGAEARKMLNRLEVEEAKLFPPAPGFLKHAVVEMQVTNHTGRRINRITFQASLRRADQLEPVVVELVHRPFGVGLAPGRQVKLRLELQDSEWGLAADSGKRAAFACCVMALEGSDNRTIASSNFGTVDEYLLAALGERLAELEALRPAP